ncbi:MAG: hypothetical protein R6V85_14830 [Polyangia bacterium]
MKSMRTVVAVLCVACAACGTAPAARSGVEDEAGVALERVDLGAGGDDELLDEMRKDAYVRAVLRESGVAVTPENRVEICDPGSVELLLEERRLAFVAWEFIEDLLASCQQSFEADPGEGDEDRAARLSELRARVERIIEDRCDKRKELLRQLAEGEGSKEDLSRLRETLLEGCEQGGER